MKESIQRQIDIFEETIIELDTELCDSIEKMRELFQEDSIQIAKVGLQWNPYEISNACREIVEKCKIYQKYIYSLTNHKNSIAFSKKKLQEILDKS